MAEEAKTGVEILPKAAVEEMVAKVKRRRDKMPHYGPRLKPEKEEVEAVSREDFEAKRKPTRTEILDWVFENMDVYGVAVQDAPSAGAYSLLMRARKNQKILESVYSMWAKLLPNKAQVQAESVNEDDGHEITLDLIDRIQMAADKARKVTAEKLESEKKAVLIGPMGITAH